MMELIDEIKIEMGGKITSLQYYGLEKAMNIALSKLEKEKEQITDAHIEGQRVFDNHTHTQWTNDQAEQYYNQTYNQNK